MAFSVQVSSRLTGNVDANLFGSFCEHLGRCVYGGLYQPTAACADKDGFRKDVLQLVHELDVPVVRYPGGNFVSSYNWRDGIGPKTDRPVKLNTAWSSVETNQFGIDEFMRWCRKVGCQPMITVNLGTGTPAEAAELVEYCNFGGKSTLSELRRKNGSPEPYNVRYWCLGNEMDGHWQAGHMDKDAYAQKALTAARMMKAVDKNIKLTACGSSFCEMPTFPVWDETVISSLYDEIDMISMHKYFHYTGNDVDYFSAPSYFERYIKQQITVCDYVQIKERKSKRIDISIDEWNIWYENKSQDGHWQEAPHILEDFYTMRDALVFAGMFQAILRHADRVKMSCVAQLVNVIAPIMTDDDGRIFRQTTFYPFRALSRFARGGEVVDCDVNSDTATGTYGSYGLIDVLAVRQNGELGVFVVNYGATEQKGTFGFEGAVPAKLLEHSVMTGALDDANDFDCPERIVPQSGTGAKITQSGVETVVPPYSWNFYRFACNFGGN